MNQLYEIANGKVVLFVNAIRSDIKSGGNLSTAQILDQLKKKSQCVEFNLSSFGEGRVKVEKITLGLPGSFFVLISKYYKSVWIEFLTRLSPFVYIQLLLTYLRLKPNIIIFNHHASFLYSLGFKKSHKVFIWHDVPSLKKYRKQSSIDIVVLKITRLIERASFQNGFMHFTFSFTDQKFLKRFYKLKVKLLAIYFPKHVKKEVLIKNNSWLMLGNWNRFENTNGAEQFLNAFLDLTNQIKQPEAFFLIAGVGADKFLKTLVCKNRKILNLNITAISNYKDLTPFEVKGVLAPISDGAGIKVKVLESWASGLPVVGTVQAFAGLPYKIYKFGGICLKGPEELAKFIINDASLKSNLMMQPVIAYEKYLQAIKEANELTIEI